MQIYKTKTALRLIHADWRKAGDSIGLVRLWGHTALVSASRASFHLATLAEAGLIGSERQSRSIIYRVDFKAMGALTGYLVHECCKDHEDVVKCC